MFASTSAGIIKDDFSAGSVTRDSTRFYETDIGDGWQADLQSAWTISGGMLQNTNTATSGIAGEGAVACAVDLEGYGGRYVELVFDYSGNTANRLAVHLWGYTGLFDFDEGWFADFQVQNGGYYSYWNGSGTSGEVHGYSLKDGSDSVAPYALDTLAESGTYSNRIDIQSLGIPGVTDVSDLSYISLAFGRKNYTGASASAVDNASLSVWPYIDADHLSGPAPLTVIFDASANSTDPDIVSYAWDFGDGSTATGMRVTNTYSDAGIYSAELTVTDSTAQSITASVGIHVSPTLIDLGAIWFIGDSITQSNADGDAAGSPRKALYDLLSANGYTFTYTGHFTANVDGLPTTGATPANNLYHYHSGISGSVIGDDFDGRTGMTENMSVFWNSGRLAQVKPDIILIMLGANDVNLSLNLPGAPERLRMLIQTIYELPGVGDPTIFLAQITPNRISSQTETNVSAFNDAIPDVVAGFRAQEKDVRLVDQFTPINDNYAAAMRADNLHPNAVGNELMAQQWYNAIMGKFPGPVSDFHGFDLHTFSTNGLDCKVAVPEVAAEGNPWIWRARFWGHEPGPDIALLSNGFHVAYVDVAGLYGAPSAVARFDQFYDLLTLSYGFDSQVVLEGMSRGGLIIYNWAARNTGRVHCIYADAPVCDFKSWPGGFGIGTGSPADWSACMDAYGFTSELEAMNYCGNPVNNVEPLARAGIPLLHVVGDDDLVVPVVENTEVMEEQCNTYGGLIKVIHKPGVGHVHGLDDPNPIVEFITNSVYADHHIPAFLPGSAVSNGVFSLRFEGTVGQHYQMEATGELTTSNTWQVCEDIPSLTVSPTNISIHTTNDAGFYRIRWFPF